MEHIFSRVYHLGTGREGVIGTVGLTGTANAFCELVTGESFESVVQKSALIS